jgi:hypothetical protein
LGLAEPSIDRVTVQREAFTPLFRVRLPLEPTRGEIKLSADNQIRRAAPTTLSPALSIGPSTSMATRLSNPASLLRPMAAFRTGAFLLLATFFSRRMGFFAAIPMAPFGKLHGAL